MNARMAGKSRAEVLPSHGTEISQQPLLRYILMPVQPHIYDVTASYFIWKKITLKRFDCLASGYERLICVPVSGGVRIRYSLRKRKGSCHRKQAKYSTMML